VSSSLVVATIGISGLDGALRLIFWQDGGMPVMGSNLVFSCAIDHDGVMRRSEDE
jgi:hypothetical protein